MANDEHKVSMGEVKLQKYHCPVHGDVDAVINISVHGYKDIQICWRCVADYAEECFPTLRRIDDDKSPSDPI